VFAVPVRVPAMTTIFSISHILADREGDGFFSGFRKKTYSKGSIVCGRERQGKGVFIVVAGKLRVYLIGEDREITLFYLVPGDIFCMHSGCIAEAMQQSEIRLADMKTLEQKLFDSPGLGWKLFGVMGSAMLSGLRTIESMAFHDVRQRIALFFLQQAGPAGAIEITGDKLHATLTIEDIAHLVGSARQTTSTVLNLLIKEGLIRRVSRGKYGILDHDRLAALATGSLSDEIAAALPALPGTRA
jgi:CRP-like cAMP-binding protein